MCNTHTWKKSSMTPSTKLNYSWNHIQLVGHSFCQPSQLPDLHVSTCVTVTLLPPGWSSAKPAKENPLVVSTSLDRNQIAKDLPAIHHRTTWDTGSGWDRHAAKCSLAQALRHAFHEAKVQMVPGPASTFWHQCHTTKDHSSMPCSHSIHHAHHAPKVVEVDDHQRPHDSLEEGGNCTVAAASNWASWCWNTTNH